MRTGLVVLAMGTWFALGCGPKYPNCETDENCKEHNEYCVDGLCQQCRTDDHCSALGPCAFCAKAGDKYTCQKPKGQAGDCCVSDTDCQGLKCCKAVGVEKGQCAQCATDADCGKGMKCVQCACVPEAECETDADCGACRKCDNGKCVTAELQLEPVYFDFDEYAIRADMRPVLERDYNQLKSCPQNVVLEGNCDERGSDEYNLALGTRRAGSVKKYLVNLGLPDANFSTVSYGEEKPVCTEHNEDCWWRNRRVDLKPR